MLKGCQKKIIMVKNTGSRIFDEAYFVLKTGVEQSGRITKTDMLREASRIVDENLLSVYCEKNREQQQNPNTNRSLLVRGILIGAFSCSVVICFSAFMLYLLL